MKLSCYARSGAILSAAFVSILAGVSSSAADDIRLRIGSSHPLTYLPAYVLNSYFQNEVNQQLEKAGSEHRITWREAYGGTMFKATDTLEAVRDGIVDVSVVISLFEGELMPLSNMTYYAPFTGASLETMTVVMDEIMTENPHVKEEWSRNGLRYLAPVVLDPYHIWSDVPLNAIDDLQGLKLNAPGVSGTWLENSGAVGVDAPLTAYYTNVQTGVTAGSLSYYTGIVGTKTHEIAPYVTEVNVGAQFTGAIAINPATFDGLPADVQAAMLEAASGYRDELLRVTQERFVAAKAEMLASGATISDFPDAARRAWIERLPNIPQRWIDELTEKGVEGADELLHDFYAKLEAAGSPAFHSWVD